ncbi:unnamed protein product [Prorocentrum cordatum]|uniref:NHR domain-containing protein n=1 Tax=Prorocentrum cordatum TaxID=2364126 RepID=A0ABN9UZZ5_9DINO|nr:unnamed protein product [Polarella glacialis]
MAADDAIMKAHRFAGRLVADMEEQVLVMDPALTGCPIVGASAGFCSATGRALGELLGVGLGGLSEGVPAAWLSRSSRANQESFCAECANPDLAGIAETVVVQPQARKDGSVFTGFTLLGLCVMPSCDGLRKCIVGAVIPCAEGMPVRLGRAVHVELEGRARGILEAARERLSTLRSPSWCCEGRVDLKDLVQADFGFFTRRLEAQAVVTGGGRTAVRRECDELPTGCLMFGDRPAQRRPEGLAFRVRVESTTGKFSGLPFVGFTTRRPCGEASDLPRLSKCLAESVIVGGSGEAFARDASTHYVMGFKPPPATEIQSWSLQPDLPTHKREPPAVAREGDEIECRYTWDGRIQFLLNDTVVMGFDTGRPLAEDAQYYAVVDVCLSTTSLTLLPVPNPMSKEMRQMHARIRAAHVSSMSTLAPCDLNSVSADGVTGCFTRQSTSWSVLSGCSNDDLGEQEVFDEHGPGRRCLPRAETILLRTFQVGLFGAGLPCAGR